MAKRKAGRPAKRAAARKARSVKRSVSRKRGARASSTKTAAGRKPTTARRKKPAVRAAATPSRTSKRAPAKRAAAAKRKPLAKKAAAKTTAKATRPVTAAPRPAPRPAASAHVMPPRLARDRRTLNDDVVQSPPSSLDMDRRGSAARSGRAEMAEHAAEHANMTPDIAGGDVDVNLEDAYFTGDEAPGGDNPTPDQDIVDDIGKALGVEYQDSEVLRAVDKVTDRDKHRWELDPASAEDYRERKP